MLEFLGWLEASALGNTLRGLGVWTYGLLNLGHITGISLLIGSLVLLDLRLLGFWRTVPMESISRPTVPVAVVGFIIAAASGICMISVNASEYVGNPFLLIKFLAIALGLLNVAVVGQSRAWKNRGERPIAVRWRRQLALAGGVSLACWLTALGAGRMIGYW